MIRELVSYLLDRNRKTATHFRLESFDARLKRFHCQDHDVLQVFVVFFAGELVFLQDCMLARCVDIFVAIPADEYGAISRDCRRVIRGEFYRNSSRDLL